MVTQNLTLDGAVEILDNWFDPAGHADVDPSDLAAHAFVSGVTYSAYTLETAA